MEEFRKMRRFRQEMTAETNEEILKNGIYGILAVLGDNGYPYTIPVNYAYENGNIYIHCAREGHKLDAIRRSPKVSFCVVDKADVVGKEYTSYFRSVIVFGKAEILSDEAEIRNVAFLLGERYRPNHPEDCRKEVDGSISRLCILRIRPDFISGKQAKELVK